MSQRQFTGYHMAALTIGFFAVVIAVNVTLAVFANETWPGLIVKNGYVASQEYNGVLEKAREQEARGWRSELTVAGGEIGFDISDRDGGAIQGLAVHARVSRPTHERDDAEIVFAARPDGGYVARHALADGLWEVDLVAENGAGDSYRRIFRLELGDARDPRRP